MASDMTMPSGVTAVCPLVPFCLSTQSGESLRPLPWDVTGGGTNGGQLALLSLRCFRRSPGRTLLRSQSQFVLLAEVRQPSRPAINSTLWEKHRVSGALSDTRVPPPHVTSATLPPQCLVGGRPGGLLATTMAGDVGGRSCTDAELLLHPELLSQEFLLLTLEQKNIAVENEVRVNKDNLTDLYVQHAIPLPQRDLPKNRWGKMMEKKREHHEVKNDTKRSSAVDGLRKRPLIVFDGSSTSTSIKVKRTENGADDRLKPLAQIGSTSDAFWKSPNSSSRISPLVLFSNLPVNHKMEHNNNDTQQNHDLTNRKSPSGPVKSPPLSPVGTTPVKLKRAAPKEEAEATNHLKPPEVKRKIQHVTWP